MYSVNYAITTLRSEVETLRAVIEELGAGFAQFGRHLSSIATAHSHDASSPLLPPSYRIQAVSYTPGVPHLPNPLPVPKGRNPYRWSKKSADERARALEDEIGSLVRMTRRNAPAASVRTGPGAQTKTTRRRRRRRRRNGTHPPGSSNPAPTSPAPTPPKHEVKLLVTTRDPPPPPLCPRQDVKLPSNSFDSVVAATPPVPLENRRPSAPSRGSGPRLTAPEPLALRGEAVSSISAPFVRPKQDVKLLGDPPRQEVKLPVVPLRPKPDDKRLDSRPQYDVKLLGSRPQHVVKLPSTALTPLPLRPKHDDKLLPTSNAGPSTVSPPRRTDERRGRSGVLAAFASPLPCPKQDVKLLASSPRQENRPPSSRSGQNIKRLARPPSPPAASKATPAVSKTTAASATSKADPAVSKTAVTRPTPGVALYNRFVRIGRWYVQQGLDPGQAVEATIVYDGYDPMMNGHEQEVVEQDLVADF